MADKEKPKAEAKDEKAEADAAAPKKKSPIKLIAIVAVVMIVEGVGLFMLLGATGKKPEAAHAQELHGAKQADEEKTVEVALIAEEFQTMQGTQVWIWDTEMVLQVKKRHEELVTTELERRSAEIKEEIAKMFRRASPNQLREPGLETLNRQVFELVNRIVGKDAEGKARVERVLIPRCRGFFAN